MKSLITISTALFFIFMVKGNIYAQTTVGAATYYGTEMDGVGLNMYGHYPLSKRTKIGLDLVWWPRNAPDDSRYLFTETNVDVQFTPFIFNRFSLYASLIAGYHYAGVRMETLGENFSTSDHMAAFGTGAGIEYDLGKISLSMGGRKFFYSGFNQLNIGGGIRIDL